MYALRTDRLEMLVVPCVLLASLVCSAFGEVTEDTCEVCVKFIRSFLDNAPSDRSPAKVRSALEDHCRGRKGKEYSFVSFLEHQCIFQCYDVGLLEESAAKTVNALVLPITMFKPAEKVCDDLKKTVTDICSLRYGMVLFC
ncbi:hypothetical protein D915_001993 [Fasciola hepatica]|uniref:ARMET N-terminal domain-containing protein n=1 Tax=Fasciola hepatica TaxID=6192 RepID=A0A4E0RI67_FASHE|nr:hypothetical protein D915_001993 [Fasciola hepatica]